MRKGMWSAAAAFVVLLSGADVLWGSPRVQAADSRVVMSDSDSDALKWHYDPADVTVTAGSTVMWHNGGAQAHTVTADDGKSFNSPSVPTGGDFQFKFATGGDFAYHCEPHPWMKGVVHVVGASTPTTAAPTTTTQPGSTATSATSATTSTTTKPGQSSTTTSAAAGSGSTTTTAGAPTTTTIASAAAPTAASDAAGTTTTTAAGNAAEGAEAAPKGNTHKKNSPVGIAFAAVSTLLLTAIAAKLLASKP